MPTHRQPSLRATTGARPGVQEAEAILVEHYPRLVRLAYLTLPPSLGRHRRVLAAHATVQRALPRTPRGGAGGEQQGGVEGAAYRWVRHRILRGALRWRWWRGGGLPLVVGLRLFPTAGGAEELALDQALSSASAPARAAFALGVLEGLRDSDVRELLLQCQVADPGAALRTAQRLRESGGGRAEALLRAAEFDPCAVQTRPSDLLRRRQRSRTAAAGGVLALLAAGVAAVDLSARDAGAPVTAHAGAPGQMALARALDVDLLQRAPHDAWTDTARLDFSVWPARGERTADRALLRRALDAWAAPGASVRVSATADTVRTGPAAPARLLYAGAVDDAVVVLFHDGARVVRYAEPRSGAGAPALDFARTDDADVTTAASIVLGRTKDGARHLLAPWIAEAAVRDLLEPGGAARALAVADGGVTAAVPSPGTGAACASWPALQLRSSQQIVEDHAFLVTDLGDLAPVHLTHTPPPGKDAPARQPREATGGSALASWARSACLLGALRGAGVRSVNDWTYAHQQLPDDAGRAAWVCTRAETWRGRGRVLVQFQSPAGGPESAGSVVARVDDTAACSRFGQHVLAGAHWRSPSGKWFLLAAGSRGVSRITAAGTVAADERGTTLAVPVPQGSPVRLSARLASGGTLAPLAATDDD
ncbi:hypothetical protein ACH41E_14240 [Streptomyces sp. NPDC020412]|uniref:hypothetical protein n=1 Tax=Streptomyces sp. NPDC020412 TaxID=3365073 RepID=UPI0037B9D0E8